MEIYIEMTKTANEMHLAILTVVLCLDRCVVCRPYSLNETLNILFWSNLKCAVNGDWQSNWRRSGLCQRRLINRPAIRRRRQQVPAPWLRNQGAGHSTHPTLPIMRIWVLAPPAAMPLCRRNLILEAVEVDIIEIITRPLVLEEEEEVVDRHIRLESYSGLVVSDQDRTPHSSSSSRNNKMDITHCHYTGPSSVLIGWTLTDGHRTSWRVSSRPIRIG